MGPSPLVKFEDSTGNVTKHVDRPVSAGLKSFVGVVARSGEKVTK